MPYRPEVRVRAARLDEIEQIGMNALELASWRGVRALRETLIPLLLDQLEEDVGIRCRQLFAHRLLPSPMPVTQTEHAAQLNITRARLYQLLGEGRVALRLRWPEGPWILRSWAFLASQKRDGEPWERLLRQVACDLFGEPESWEE
jgi:hypothetical protein